MSSVCVHKNSWSLNVDVSSSTIDCIVVVAGMSSSVDSGPSVLTIVTSDSTVVVSTELTSMSDCCTVVGLIVTIVTMSSSSLTEITVTGDVSVGVTVVSGTSISELVSKGCLLIGDNVVSVSSPSDPVSTDDVSTEVIVVVSDTSTSDS